MFLLTSNPVNLLLYSTVFVYIHPQYTYQQFIISFLAMKDHMKGVLVPNQRKGGSNLKDQNNFVCRKARHNAYKTKCQYKCVKVDSIKCRAAVWLYDETLMVEKSNHEHNHSPLLLEMLAMKALGLFSVQSLHPYFISTLVQYIQVLYLHTCRLVRLSAGLPTYPRAWCSNFCIGVCLFGDLSTCICPSFCLLFLSVVMSSCPSADVLPSCLSVSILLPVRL
jgi:hypothetical protein